MDVLYEKQPYQLPVSLEIGDKVLIEGTGAYTATYSSVAFNGFAPLKTCPHLHAGSRHAGSPSERLVTDPAGGGHGTIRRNLGRRARRCSTPPTAPPASASRPHRLRAGRAPARGLSFVAVEDGAIVGTVRLWDVVGRHRPAGAAARAAGRASGLPPPRHRLDADAPCLAEARRRGHAAVLLVGDAGYYGRFGFSAEQDRAAVAARASTTRTGCSVASSVRARSHGAQGQIAAPRFAPRVRRTASPAPQAA